MSSNKRTADNFLASPRVIIIGGGIGGITSGIALKQQLGFHDFTIYERSDDIGGTWHLNTYPGCAADVVTHWYSLSTDLNPEWKQTHVLQPELKAYWKNLAGKYQLYAHVSLYNEVLSAEWDAARQVYRVEVRDVRTGLSHVDYANVIISALGIVDTPSHPKDLRGIQDTFKGEHFHSARWDHSVSLQNKRVAVIGNGCSAAQFVPIISEDTTTQVVSFVRTPAWFVPNIRREYTELQRNIFKHVPLALRAYRYWVTIQQELMYFYIMAGGPNSRHREKFTNLLKNHIQETVPAEYVKQLTPTYPAGCKRFIIDTGYLEALHRPNNNLNFDGIAEVTENGILTKRGELLEFDVIIEATGFVADEYPIKLRGVNGVTIQEYYRERGGPEAYRGTAVPGFPNFFMVFGPNTLTGHGSVVYTEEVQANYIMKMLTPILKGQAASFEVTHEASDSWNRTVQKRHSTSVWSFCHSWYRAGSSGKNSALWPGPLTEQWWLLLWPDWRHYKIVGAKRWAARRFWARVRRMVVLGGLIMACVGRFVYPNHTWQVIAHAKEKIDILFLAVTAA